MAKKTARGSSKPGQHRTKEEQWRRRMAQQSQAGASSVLAEPVVAPASDTATTYTDEETPTEAPRRGAPASPAVKRAASASAMAQRTAASAARNVRSRLSTYTLSLDEEMGYIRNDIRKLVILTVICIALLIVLAFLLPSIIK